MTLFVRVSVSQLFIELIYFLNKIRDELDFYQVKFFGIGTYKHDL